jgi:hypothetical protein
MLAYEGRHIVDVGVNHYPAGSFGTVFGYFSSIHFSKTGGVVADHPL